MITHTHTRGINAAGRSVTKRIEVQAESEIFLNPTIASGAANSLHALVIDVSQLKSLFIVSDQDIVLETNSGSSPINVITLTANKPFSWATGDGDLLDTAGDAITTDITALYATNAGDDDAVLQFFALLDPTV